MKTFKNLYPQIIAFENLYHAYRLARRGKRDRAAVADFEFNLESKLLDLQSDLQMQTYRPGEYHNFYIFEPKRRLVSAAPFRDRVVHHALCQVIEPIWERRFIHHSYACRVGKGTHAALDQANAWVRQYAYAFHGDVVKYFPSIDHQILVELIKCKIVDRQTLELIKTLVDSGAGIQTAERPLHYFPGDDLFAVLRPTGLPIGNLTSQFWANVYLHELDQFVKQRLHVPAYLRYMDDFVLFSDEKAQLHAWKSAIRDFLGERLRLLLHETKSVIQPTRIGLDFCGFVLFPTHRRIRRSSIRRFVRRFRTQREAYRAGKISLEKMTLSVQCWVAHAAHGDTWRLRNKLFRNYPIPTP